MGKLSEALKELVKAEVENRFNEVIHEKVKRESVKATKGKIEELIQESTKERFEELKKLVMKKPVPSGINWIARTEGFCTFDIDVRGNFGSNSLIVQPLHSNDIYVKRRELQNGKIIESYDQRLFDHSNYGDNIIPLLPGKYRVVLVVMKE